MGKHQTQLDLDTAEASRADLVAKRGKSYRLLINAKLPPEGVIASYDKIIAELKTELQKGKRK